MAPHTSSVAIADLAVSAARESEPEAKSSPRASPRPVVPRRSMPAILAELLRANVISPAQAEQVMATRERDGRRLSASLVESGLVTESRLMQVVSRLLGAPWVSLGYVRLSEDVRSLVPWALAEEYCVLPLFMRMRPHKVLYVAIDDPSDELALHRVAEWAAMPVRAMLAPPSAIRAAIQECYDSVDSCW